MGFGVFVFFLVFFFQKQTFSMPESCNSRSYSGFPSGGENDFNVAWSRILCLLRITRFRRGLQKTNPPSYFQPTWPKTSKKTKNKKNRNKIKKMQKRGTTGKQ
jgi:hypothetical protein